MAAQPQAVLCNCFAVGASERGGWDWDARSLIVGVSNGACSLRMDRLNWNWIGFGGWSCPLILLPRLRFVSETDVEFRGEETLRSAAVVSSSPRVR